ncbi:enoyl-CoA hydratase/carnithine racemase [Clostridium beijerinckii]|nr:enoyl-CoA hydratase/carnithine racemase [Clostridium beijerinckii]
MENIKVKEENGISVVCIDRPKSLNALNTQTLKELGQIINDISERKDIYCYHNRIRRKGFCSWSRYNRNEK